jgi:uncharacterized membrane protein YfcA
LAGWLSTAVEAISGTAAGPALFPVTLLLFCTAFIANLLFIQVAKAQSHLVTYRRQQKIYPKIPIRAKKLPTLPKSE